MIGFAVVLAVSGLLLVAGLFVAAGKIELPRPIAGRRIDLPAKKVLLSLALALVVGLLTHMVVASLAAAVIPYLVPALRLKNPQAGAMARLEALVCWTEALRDALRTSGLEDALRRVSQTASAVIGREMRRLVHNLDPKVGMSTGNALRALADDLDDPSADAIIAPLVLAVEQQPAAIEEMKTVPIVAVKPTGEEVAVAEVVQAPPAEVASNEPAPAEPAAAELPQTASQLPLVGLVGLLSLGGCFGLFYLSKRIA